MKFETIKYEVQDNAARITLNRPDQLNALTAPVLEELHQALRLAAASRDTVRAVMITGAGRGFCSGADLAAAYKVDESDPKDMLRDLAIPVCNLLKNLGIPTVAAVNGPCAGVGMSLALNCDLVIAAESAFFVAAFVNVGRVPDGGASWTLTHALGNARAMAMMMLGERLSAAQAVDWGLIWKSVPGEQLMPEADKLMHKLANGPTLAYGFIRQLARAATHNSFQEQMQQECEFQMVARYSEDAREAGKAFAEKRPPVFRGR